jgi:predicted permease
MEIFRDLVLSARSLRKSPAFAVTSVITIALGIAATTAIFSVVNAVLLRPLPYSSRDRLVIITNDLTRRNVRDFPVASGDVFDIRKMEVLDGVAAVTPGRAPILGEEGPPQVIQRALVTTNLFQTLGARIMLGRDFVEEDGVASPPPPPAAASQPGQPPAPQAPPPPLPIVGIMSYQFWQSRFGGNPNIVGKSIDLAGNKVDIVGVLAPEFELLFPPNMNVDSQPALYTAARANFETGSRQNVQWRLVGRLKEGVSLAQARSQFERLSADLRKQFPVKESAGTNFRVEPMHENLVADVRPSIVALMGAVMFVLLIACANVANLLLVRGGRRERELAVRSALGGTRTRLVREMLAESIVLAAAGGILGILLAQAAIRVLISVGPANLPRLSSISIDASVVAFTSFAALLAASVFGVVPALSASQPRLSEVLRAGSRSAGMRSGRWLRNGVVIGEVALSLVLLIGSGLMLRSFMALQRVDPGFNPKGVLTFNIVNVRTRSDEERAAFLQRVHDRLEKIQGVTGVTEAVPIPQDGGNSLARWGTEAALTDPNKFQQGIVHFTLPGYFEVLGTPVVDGRTFTAADNVIGRKVMIIDDQLAAMAFPNESAVGKRLLARITSEQAEFHEIIGVVKHQRHTALATPGEEAMFVPPSYIGFGSGRWAVRTSGDLSQAAALIREAIKEINPQYVVAEMQPMQDYIDRAGSATRFALLLVIVFGVIAAILAVVGLYGVLSTTVSQRTAEIGVRMTFGATKKNIFKLVVGQGLVLSAVGVAVGLVAAFALTGAMRTMLVGVAPTDPLTFVSIAILFIVLAAFASWIPARRAAALDPSVALREQ